MEICDKCGGTMEYFGRYGTSFCVVCKKSKDKPKKTEVPNETNGR